MKFIKLIPIFLLSILLLDTIEYSKSKMPFEKVGLTQRQAVAILIDKFSYRPTPGLIDSIVIFGIDNWFLDQLKADNKDIELEKIESFMTLKMTTNEISDIYINPGKLLIKAKLENAFD